MGDSAAFLETGSVHYKHGFRAWMHPKSRILKAQSPAYDIMEKWQHLEEVGLSGRKLGHWGRIEKPGLQPFSLFLATEPAFSLIPCCYTRLYQAESRRAKQPRTECSEAMRPTNLFLC